MLCDTHQFLCDAFAFILELEVAVIIIDFGRLGKAKLHRPTWLELLALLALLAFVAVVLFRP